MFLWLPFIALLVAIPYTNCHGREPTFFLDQTGRHPRLHLSPTLDLNLSYHEKPVSGRENTIFSSHPLNSESYLGRSVQRQLADSDCNLQQRNTAKSKPWSSKGRDKGDKCLDFPFLTFLLSCQCFLLSACIQGQEHTEEIYKSGSPRAHRMEEVRVWSHTDKWKILS